MKRTAVVLIILFLATSAFAGGKACQSKDAKSVALTGSLVKAEGGKTVFRVANSDKSYTVCHETRDAILALDGTLEVTGKLVTCDEAKGQELVIEKARKI